MHLIIKQVLNHLYLRTWQHQRAVVLPEIVQEMIVDLYFDGGHDGLYAYYTLFRLAVKWQPHLRARHLFPTIHHLNLMLIWPASRPLSA